MKRRKIIVLSWLFGSLLLISVQAQTTNKSTRWMVNGQPPAQFSNLEEWVQSLPEDPKTLLKKDEDENFYFALFDNGNSEIIAYSSTEKPNGKLYVPPSEGSLGLSWGWDFFDRSEREVEDNSIVYGERKWNELRQRENKIRDKFLEKGQNQTEVNITPLRKEFTGELRVEFSARYTPFSSKEEIIKNWSTKIIWPLSAVLEKPINILKNGDFARNKSDWDTSGIVVVEGTNKFLKVKARRSDHEMTKIPFEVKDSTRTVHIDLRLRAAPDFKTFYSTVGAVYVQVIRPDGTFQYWDFQVTGTNWQEFSCICSELLGYTKFNIAVGLRPGVGFMHIDDVSIGEKSF